MTNRRNIQMKAFASGLSNEQIRVLSDESYSIRSMIDVLDLTIRYRLNTENIHDIMRILNKKIV